MWIIVQDAKGFEVGCDSGVFKPSDHRVLIEGTNLYGAENFIGHFRDKNGKLNVAEWQMFAQLLLTLPQGEYRELSWQRE